VELALFPSYVFVKIAVKERLRVLQLSGVVNLVTFNGHLAAVPEEQITALRKGLENDICAEPCPYLKVGKRVRVVRGPMAGSEGILVRKKDKYRFVLSIDVLMRSVSVEVDAGDVQALSS
jgi:transcription antitermination factor NusG